ncbi:MAG: hypothetical protein HY803_11135 [candidate division NC10 bacterium]|nr:hypothetical protein [candidate division NC10 bacterium]
MQGRIEVEQERPVLEQGPIPPALGRSDELPPAHQDGRHPSQEKTGACLPAVTGWVPSLPHVRRDPQSQ